MTTIVASFFLFETDVMPGSTSENNWWLVEAIIPICVCDSISGISFACYSVELQL